MSRRTVDPPVGTLGWLWLVGGLGLVLAPHLLRLPVWLGLFSVGAIAWRVARDLRGWPLPGVGVRLMLTLLAIVAVLAAFGTVIGKDAGVALLAVMLSLKLMEMTTLRDAMLVVLLAYFLVAAGFLFDQSLFAGIYLFGTVVVLTAALLVLNHPGATLALTRDYLRRSASLLLQSLPLMAVLFVLFPRVQSLGLGLAPSEGSAHTGLSDSMEIGDVDQLANSREVAFRVEFASSPPPANDLYWRGPVLWHTDGRRWSGLSQEELRNEWPPRPFVPEGAPVNYVLSLEPQATGRWIPALDIPSTVPNGSILSADLQLFTSKAEGTRRYALQSYPRYRLTGLSAGLRETGLALPPEENPRTRELAQEWATADRDPRRLVSRAMAYFREETFFYTRRPPLLGPDPVDQFLFESRKGFCEHFAAAFVTLMRAAGVPARVVTGYQGGELNTVGNYWVVRQSDAHAWAEVYLNAEGWVRVDPTTAIPPDRIAADLFEETLEQGSSGASISWTLKTWRWAGASWDAVNYQWDRWIAGYSQERQQELFKRFGLLDSRGAIAALVLTAAMALLLAAWFTHRSAREPDPARRHYLRFCRKLARLGFARRNAEGEGEYAARVSRARPDLADSVRTITEIYQRARYGRGGVTALRRLKAAVTGFRG